MQGTRWGHSGNYKAPRGGDPNAIGCGWMSFFVSREYEARRDRDRRLLMWGYNFAPMGGSGRFQIDENPLAR